MTEYLECCGRWGQAFCSPRNILQVVDRINWLLGFLTRIRECSRITGTRWIIGHTSCCEALDVGVGVGVYWVLKVKRWNPGVGARKRDRLAGEPAPRTPPKPHIQIISTFGWEAGGPTTSICLVENSHISFSDPIWPPFAVVQTFCGSCEAVERRSPTTLKGKRRRNTSGDSL
jgi:hypothetical protein